MTGAHGAMPRSDVRCLPGWRDDGLVLALEAFDRSRPAGWPAPTGQARAFFEANFTPRASQSGLVTGYYEPEISGSRERSPAFPVPLHGMPQDWDGIAPWHTRAEIVAGDLLVGQEIVWVESPLEAFLAQVQGSVRVRLQDGRTVRLGYAGKNGHPYRSIAAELVRRGEVPADAMSVAAIRAWCAAQPEKVSDLLAVNPSYVFFRSLDLRPTDGPISTVGCPLTPLRSVAIDPTHVPLGAPVWIETDGPEGLRRLMIAQDTGSAILGAGRCDVYFGSGDAAGERAGRMAEQGRVTVLVPRDRSE